MVVDYMMEVLDTLEWGDCNRPDPLDNNFALEGYSSCRIEEELCIQVLNIDSQECE